jgi:thiol-disulfide isomerase/thioredoxin
MMDSSKEESTMEKSEWSEEEMKKMEAEETMMEKDEMMKEEEIVKTSSVENTLSGTYSEYSPEKLSATQNNILFFAATWCPACQNADKNFSASKIPVDINLLKVDYDSNEELRKQYGVTMQHTFVLVDEE